MTGKETTNKPKLSLVPPEILTAVSRIREYGCQKYESPHNWKNVPPQEFWEAVIRHTRGAWEDWKATDEESGMPHIWHVACNISFLCAFLEREEVEKTEKAENPENLEESVPEPVQEKPIAKNDPAPKSSKPSPRRKIDVDKVLELRKNGLRDKEIADFFGVAPASISQTIYKHRKENGTKEENPSNSND